MNIPLTNLRNEMKKRGIDVYLIPTADFHESEYVGEHFKARRFVTGFTGSAGTAVITADEANLWTDGRYFLQAAKQLEGKDVILRKMGEPGVPTLLQYIDSVLPQGGVLGFDGRVVNTHLGEELEAIADGHSASLHTGEDLVDLIWEDRPPLPAEPVWILENQYAGRDAAEKLMDVRAEMAAAGADVHLLTSLYDIAWLLNLRGGDIDYVPVILSYLAVEKTDCYWFVQDKILTPEIRAYLAEKGVEPRPYDSFYDYAQGLSSCAVLLDEKVCNYRLVHSLQPSVIKILQQNPTVLPRSIKNETEMRNIRAAHLSDAVAMCKFLFWLKTNIGKIRITELSATEYLENLRREQGCLEPSFETITGYAAHGSVIHYAPSAETDVELKPEGLLLVDSGGHYLTGTTDITRTVALGPLTQEMRADFTRVLRSNLNLAAIRFLHGCSGMNLDVIARAPLWEAGVDYKHGTGHGVGYVLNVHEGPNGFRWRQSPDRSEGAVLEEGMITTDEPGIYRDGCYGIRLESELLCRKGEENEYGQFMYFENLTYVPMDLNAADLSAMSSAEIRLLNEYHRMVYETVAPHLAEDERAWLAEATRAV